MPRVGVTQSVRKGASTLSSHPNAMLILKLTPDGLARKTYRAILAECGIVDVDDDVKIGGLDYHHKVMESDYDEDWQLSAAEGQIVFHDFLTYGYGEQVTWAELVARHDALEEWAKGVCGRHSCSYEIVVGANYW